MTRRSAILLLGLVAAAGALVLAVAAQRYRAAAGELRSAGVILMRTTADARRLATLRADRAMLPPPRLDDSELSRLVRETADAAAIPARLVGAVRAERDTDLAGPTSSARRDGSPAATLKKQAARAELRGVTLPQLGRFLNAWRLTHPRWIVTRIDLTRSTAARAGARRPSSRFSRSAAAGTSSDTTPDAGYDITLRLENIYLDAPGLSTAFPPSAQP